MRIISIACAIAFSSALAAPLSAHHSFAAQFDANKPVTLEGTVTNVEWRSPHIWVYVDVKGEDGVVSSWECEGGAPNALTRQGWTRETLKLGTRSRFRATSRETGAIPATRERGSTRGEPYSRGPPTGVPRRSRPLRRNRTLRRNRADSLRYWGTS